MTPPTTQPAAPPTPQPTGVGPLTVTGGAGGTTARYDDMETTAGLLGRASGDLLGVAAVNHRHLADPNVVASAVLDPVGAARFESAMLGALDGEGGLTRTAGQLGVQAVKLKAAVVTYRTTDDLQARLIDGFRFASGALAVAGAPVLLPAALAKGGGWVLDELLHGRDIAADLQKIITDDPGIIDTIVGASPGAITAINSLLLGPAGPLAGMVFTQATGQTLFPTSPTEGAGLLGLLYPDGKPIVTDLGTDPAIAGTRAPQGVGDLMAGLDYRNSKASGADQGQIDVRAIEKQMPDGSIRKSYVVDVPGTKDWQFNPAGDRTHLNDFGTNLHALSGETTAYEQGIADALRRAGVQPGDPVMLVGHSQGGMVAVHAADGFVRSGQFNVTHVVTAGSPVARMPVPSSVQVLSIENQHDIVPHLDARENPDLPNRTTVKFDRQYGTVGENHGITSSYRPAADSVDASTDPSIRRYLDSASDFLNGDSATSHVYQVTRDQQ
jgi:hypothetical protein